MTRRVVIFLFACSIAFAVANAGGRKELRSVRALQPIVDDGVERSAKTGSGQYIPGLDSPTALTWVVVDSMANAFGPANSNITPLMYDPGTNTVAIVHRGAAPYSTGGRVWRFRQLAFPAYRHYAPAMKLIWMVTSVLVLACEKTPAPNSSPSSAPSVPVATATIAFAWFMSSVYPAP